MKVFIVFCHPSKESITNMIKEKFIQGLKDAKHEVIISDLYEMNFKADMSLNEYNREANYLRNEKLDDDVLAEQAKIQSSDAIAFIYPCFWTEAPAKLKGWFDRVWTAGFAYNPNPAMKKLEKAIFLVSAGKSIENLITSKEKEAMETIMLGDRIKSRAKHKEMIFFDETTKFDIERRKAKMEMHLLKAYEIGYYI